MPLSRVLFAEKKFVEADFNNDGVRVRLHMDSLF